VALRHPHWVAARYITKALSPKQPEAQQQAQRVRRSIDATANASPDKDSHNTPTDADLHEWLRKRSVRQPLLMDEVTTSEPAVRWRCDDDTEPMRCGWCVVVNQV
jgi:hypothetical protein